MEKQTTLYLTTINKNTKFMKQNAVLLFFLGFILFSQ
jgi:hypothetical protein